MDLFWRSTSKFFRNMPEMEWEVHNLAPFDLPSNHSEEISGIARKGCHYMLDSPERQM
jgi:hypothetical protein